MKHLKNKKKRQSDKKTTRRRKHGDNKNGNFSIATWVDRIQLEPVVAVVDHHDDDDDDEEDDGDDDYDNSVVVTSLNGRHEPESKQQLQQQHDNHCNDNNNDDDSQSPSISIVSWNILAASYCSRRSQRNLPRSYQSTVFNSQKRQRLLQRVLQTQFVVRGKIDVLCLQEVDMDVVQDTLMAAGYSTDSYCETDRTKSGGRAAGKVDSCAIYVRTEGQWTLLKYEQIRLDDLATLSSSSSSSSTNNHNNGGSSSSSSLYENDGVEKNNNNNTFKQLLCNSNIQGIQQAFLRRNMALLARLRHKATGRTIVVANAHLYWHPGYEYVKLCQAHYILQRARSFLVQPNEPFVFCGDLNSKPSGVTYSYLSRGYINAKKRLSPWYTPSTDPFANNNNNNQDETDEVDDGNCAEQQSDVDLVDEMGQLALDKNDETTNSEIDDEDDNDESSPPPQMRYLLDFTLNRFCRWLRILGQDTVLETDEEERLRTGEGNMLLFDKCRRERRTLVTTSTRLVQRKDCPSSVYCINPTVLPNLEVTLVHLLLTHGVVLEPTKFLTRCVVCNGSIVGVEDLDEAKAILEEYQAPSAELIGTEDSDLNVYKCDNCGQGYWFSDRPNSSASRVMATATRLFEICLRAGVPCTDDLGAFDHVDVEKERARGWDWTEKGSELLRRPLQVIDWLKSPHLECPFKLESAYAKKSSDGKLLGEILPFTNVTYDFVDTLDYIFYDKRSAVLTERLYAPTTFSELNNGEIRNGHLIPSNIWPSDHLAIGARLLLQPQKGFSQEENSSSQVDISSSVPYCLPTTNNGALEPVLSIPQSPILNHGRRCDCGCIPPTPSLFEMAELRRQARLKKAQESAEATRRRKIDF